jgi:threonine aldolase
MREQMIFAEEGDDYYSEDKSVNRLQDYCKELFGKEDALFATTGMLANQLAVISQMKPGNELITEYTYHINLYESAQYACFCHVVLNGRETSDGILRAEDVRRAIESKPRESIYAQVELVTIENTINSSQGKVFPFPDIQSLRVFTHEHGLRLHMDGARLFNAHIATGISLAAYAAEVDTLSVCFSKSLGAPLGSLLLGPKDVIDRSRRFRMWHGSGFHQIGFCAEAAYFGLIQQLNQLTEDHRLAKLLAEKLATNPNFNVRPETVETNMVFLRLPDGGEVAREFEQRCRERGVLVFVFPPDQIRLVVCRNVNEGEIVRAAQVLNEIGYQMEAAGLLEQCSRN